MITKTMIDRLAAGEREELEAILAEARGKRAPTARYQSDAGDASAWYLLLLIAAGLGIVAHVVVFGGFGAVPEFWRTVTTAPAIALSPGGGLVTLGFQVAIVVAPWSAWKLISIYGRHGWALASFGFVRVRGKRIQLVRVSDIVRVDRTRFGGGGQRRFSVIKITSRDGGVLSSYASALFDELCKRVPAGTTINPG
jgi:hypothetical protein